MKIEITYDTDKLEDGILINKGENTTRVTTRVTVQSFYQEIERASHGYMRNWSKKIRIDNCDYFFNLDEEFNLTYDVTRPTFIEPQKMTIYSEKKFYEVAMPRLKLLSKIEHGELSSAILNEANDNILYFPNLHGSDNICFGALKKIFNHCKNDEEIVRTFFATPFEEHQILGFDFHYAMACYEKYGYERGVKLLKRLSKLK